MRLTWSVNSNRRSMRSTVEYGSRPKYAKPGMFTPMSLPPGSWENPKCKPRLATWARNSLNPVALRMVSCWNTMSRSRDWFIPVRDPAFSPKVWFCAVDSVPVTSDGDTPIRRNELLLLFHFWSSRSDQRLVFSVTGKFPRNEFNALYEVGSGTIAKL